MKLVVLGKYIQYYSFKSLSSTGTGDFTDFLAGMETSMLPSGIATEHFDWILITLRHIFGRLAVCMNYTGFRKLFPV